MWRQDPVTEAWKHYRRKFNKDGTVEYIELVERKKLTREDTVTLTVRCSGHLHTLSFTPNKPAAPGRRPVYGGSLTMHHHDAEDLVLEQAMAQLGGKLSRCFVVRKIFIDALKTGGWYIYIGRKGLPTELRHVLKDIFQPERRARENIRYKLSGRAYAFESPTIQSRDLSIPFPQRVPHIILALVKKTLQESRYFSDHRDLKHDRYMVTAISQGYPPNGTIQGYSSSFSIGVNLSVQVDVKRWWNLYRLGAALVEGIFIVDVAGEEDQARHPVQEHELLVLAGKPNTRSQQENVETNLAIIRHTEKGWELVSWVDARPQR